MTKDRGIDVYNCVFCLTIDALLGSGKWVQVRLSRALLRQRHLTAAKVPYTTLLFAVSEVSMSSAGHAATHFRRGWLAAACNAFPHSAGTMLKHWQIQVHRDKRNRNVTDRRRPTADIFLIWSLSFPKSSYSEPWPGERSSAWGKSTTTRLASFPQYALFIWLCCLGTPPTDYLCKSNPHMLGFLTASY